MITVALKDLFGKDSAIYQLFVWQVAGQIVSAVLQPTITLVTQQINGLYPVQELSPAELANLVGRAWITMDAGKTEASHAGINGDRFEKMVHLTQSSPNVGDLTVAYRRGLIKESGTGQDATSLEQGLREAGLNPKWVGLIKELAVQWPSPNDALDALLEGQIDSDTGKSLYSKFGGDPDYFQMLYNTRGNAPTPVEALTLANRGIIKWSGSGPESTSYEQAFLEGPWRNKWLEPFKALGEYLPPPRTVTAMVGSGALTPDQATQLLLKQGLSQELATAYVQDALNGQNAVDKQLTTSQLLDMYSAQLISVDDVTPLLAAIGYSAESIDWLLSYRDLQRSIAAVNSAVSRIHTLYTTYKIERDEARNALTSLHVSGAQVGGILDAWDIERTSNIKTLTAAQIGDAWKYLIISQTEALTELQGLGYTARDAWIYLSIVAKAPLDQAPPAQGPGGAVPSGTGATS